MLSKGRAYWRGAAANFGLVRMLAVCAMFIAMRIAIGALFIPVGENLRVYFTYAVTALGASIYGPLMALAEGFVSDILGYFIAPSGGFFPGYTLSAMLGSVTYALFFYQQKQSFLRIFLSRMTVNVVVNILIGSVWSAVLYGKGYIYYVSKSVVKNHTAFVYEDVCRERMWELNADGAWPFFFTKLGKYWDSNTEIDITALDPEDKNLILGECKYWSDPVGISVLRDLEAKASAVSWERDRRKVWYVLFSASGFTEELKALAESRQDLLLCVE